MKDIFFRPVHNNWKISSSGQVLFIAGDTLFHTSILIEFIDDYGYLWTIGNIMAWTFSNSFLAFLFIQPACLTVEILLCAFSSQCKDLENLEFKKNLQIIRLYEIIDKALGKFLFIFIATSGIFIIFLTFLAFSTYFMKTDPGLTDLLFFFALIITSLSYCLNLMGIMFACDDAFNHLKHLKIRTEKEVWQAREPGRITDLKYTLRLLDDIEPLSACGYFSITKSSITSMVSVRWELYLCKNVNKVLINVYKVNTVLLSLSIHFIALLFIFLYTNQSLSMTHSKLTKLPYLLWLHNRYIKV